MTLLPYFLVFVLILPPVPSLFILPRPVMDTPPKVLDAWARVMKIYPVSAALVTGIEVADLDVSVNPGCMCDGTVLPELPTVIWLDGQYVTTIYTLQNLEGLLVHEMFHVVQFTDAQMADLPAREREAYLAQDHYHKLRTIEDLTHIPAAPVQ